MVSWEELNHSLLNVFMECWWLGFWNSQNLICSPKQKGKTRCLRKFPDKGLKDQRDSYFKLKLTDMKKKYFTKRPHGHKLKMMLGKHFLPMFMWKGVLFSPLRWRCWDSALEPSLCSSHLKVRVLNGFEKKKQLKSKNMIVLIISHLALSQGQLGIPIGISWKNTGVITS